MSFLELAERDPHDLVVAPRDVRAHVGLAEVDLVLGERRFRQDLGEHRQDLVEGLGQGLAFDGPGGLADAGLDLGAEAVEELIDLVAGHRAGAAGALHLAEQLGKAAPPGGLGEPAAAHRGAERDLRQVVVLDEEELHPVRQRRADHRRHLDLVQLGVLDGVDGPRLPGLRPLPERGGGGHEEGEQGNQGQGESWCFHGSLLAAAHFAACSAGFSAVVSIMATLRLDLTNRARATRWMSAGVTLSTLASQRNASRQSPCRF